MLKGRLIDFRSVTVKDRPNRIRNNLGNFSWTNSQLSIRDGSRSEDLVVIRIVMGILYSLLWNSASYVVGGFQQLVTYNSNKTWLGNT
jgi:hypothetical protein